MDWGIVIAACVPTVGVVGSAWITARSVNRKVDQVHKEVRTGNAQTIGTLSSIAHGRDIKTDTPGPERSESDHHYVALYDQDRTDPQH